MEISSLNRQVRAADVPIDKIAGNSRLSEKEKVTEVSRQFEAVLVRQILNNAQKTHFKSKNTGDSTSSGIYQDMVTNQMADGISKGGALGLATTLASQMGREPHHKTAPPAAPAPADPWPDPAPSKGGASNLLF